MAVQRAEFGQPLQRMTLGQDVHHQIDGRLHQAASRPDIRAVRAGAQQQIQKSVGPDLLECPPAQLRAQRQSTALAVSLQTVRQLQQDLPVMAGILAGIEQGIAVFGNVAHREHAENQVVMATLKCRGRWQDYIGMAGGLVQVVIHRDHEVHALQRLIQSTAIGVGQHRVTGHGHERLDLALARSEHFVGHGAGRVLTGKFRQLFLPG